jgi:hypothetical protein
MAKSPAKLPDIAGSERHENIAFLRQLAQKR